MLRRYDALPPPLTLTEAREQISVLRHELREKDLELNLYLHVAANQESFADISDGNAHQTIEALKREVSELSEPLGMIVVTSTVQSS